MAFKTILCTKKYLTSHSLNISNTVNRNIGKIDNSMKTHHTMLPFFIYFSQNHNKSIQTSLPPRFYELFLFFLQQFFPLDFQIQQKVHHYLHPRLNSSFNLKISRNLRVRIFVVVAMR